MREPNDDIDAMLDAMRNQPEMRIVGVQRVVHEGMHVGPEIGGGMWLRLPDGTRYTLSAEQTDRLERLCMYYKSWHLHE